jgi:hypothetical protein
VEAVMNLAVSPEFQTQTGLYFDGTRPARAQAQAYDPLARQRLTTLSMHLSIG